jgi:hypothetical protein
MLIVEIIIGLFIWLASGHAIEKIYTKAGFKDNPKIFFWIPGLNLLLILYLAFVSWPRFKEEV